MTGVAALSAQYRQGDVLLSIVERLPAGLEAMPMTGPVLALMPPGATGGGTHLLPLAAGLRAFRQAGQDGPAEWLQLDQPVTLSHPEHALLTLGPGCWHVARQRQYAPSPDGAVHRLVFD